MCLYAILFGTRKLAPVLKMMQSWRRKKNIKKEGHMCWVTHWWNKIYFKLNVHMYSLFIFINVSLFCFHFEKKSKTTGRISGKLVKRTVNNKHQTWTIFKTAVKIVGSDTIKLTIYINKTLSTDGSQTIPIRQCLSVEKKLKKKISTDLGRYGCQHPKKWAGVVGVVPKWDILKMFQQRYISYQINP